MAEIVNLRRARKARDRVARADEAAQNRVAFGISKLEKLSMEAERHRTEQRLDQHRLAASSDADRADPPGRDG